jgi:deazaflavin-dependent oxidoreductase (nitroreductase family)
VAGRLPYFGVVLHQGRTSGRLHRTPVNAFPHEDGFLVALTYGRDVDWVRNVMAAGGCRLIHRGRVVDLFRPSVLPLGEAAQAIPGLVGGILRIIRVSDVLKLRSPQVEGRQRA